MATPKKTEADKAVDKVNAARAAGKITKAEAQLLRQTITSSANADGSLGAKDTKAVSAALTAASGKAASSSGGTGGSSGNSTSGSGTTGSGGSIGGGGTKTPPSTDQPSGGPPSDVPASGGPRPDAPGKAWVWSDKLGKWVKPAAPGDGQSTWDDNAGWVKRPTQPGSAWVWVGDKGKGSWQKPTQPSDGKSYTWDDSNGWVADTTDTTTPTPPPTPTTPPVDYTNALDVSRRAMAELGFNTDWFTQTELNGFFTQLDDWITSGYSNDDLLLLIRTDKATKPLYEKRFPGMAALTQRGQAMSESEYVRMEREYRNVLSSYNLPKVFYDSPDDYGKFIGNGVSVAEVQDRVQAAKQMLDSSNPAVLNALTSYYGVGRDGALAYLLDADKAQDTIRQQVRQAQIGGMANQYGFNVGAGDASMYAGTATGQAFDPFDARTTAQLGDTFQTAAEVAKRESVLAGIDREAYTSSDTLAATFGDQQKALASKKRAERERARFAGSSAATNTSLGVERNL